MPEVESEVKVPLLVDEKEKVVSVQEGRKPSFLLQRLTYYWIVFVSQSLQIGLSITAFVMAKGQPKDDDDEHVRFIGSAIYSLLSFLAMGFLLATHYKKCPDTGPKKITAVHHVAVARSCAFMSILNLLLIFGPLALQYARGDGSNDIRSIIIPVDLSLFLISAVASSIAGYITYTAAKRVRGTEQVADPDHRVPAWTLATTSECQGISAGNPVQLA